MTVDNIDSLYEFIDRAQKNRKYLPNVATNFKTPLRLIEKELSDEEKGSINLLKTHLDEIINVIYSKPNNILSAASLGIYKRRILQLIDDYNNYGKDPNKMASWSRPIQTRKPSSKNKIEKIISGISNKNHTHDPSRSEDSERYEAFLKEGKLIIFTPKVMSKEDIETIEAYVTFLKSKHKIS